MVKIQRTVELLTIGTLIALFSFILIGASLATHVAVLISGAATVDTRAVIIVRMPYLCSIPLQSGPNLVSIPCITFAMNTSDALESIAGSYSSVHGYVDDPADPWKSYNPSLPNWTIQDLTLMDRKTGYWIYVPENTTYTLVGNLSKPNVIELVPGWNLLGYPTNESMDAGTSFTSLLPASIYATVYNASDAADHWKKYEPGALDNDLTITDTYLGYWIYTNESNEWVIEW